VSWTLLGLRPRRERLAPRSWRLVDVAVSSSPSAVLIRRRFRGRTEAESEDREAGARADEDLCGEGLAERLGSVMIATNSATTEARGSCTRGFASVRGTQGVSPVVVVVVIQFGAMYQETAKDVGGEMTRQTETEMDGRRDRRWPGGCRLLAET
jgi:hypothetical protein